MNILRYNPFATSPHQLNALADHLFNGSIADFVGNDCIHNQPAVNISETEKEFRIQLAAPGLDKNDFRINIENEHLEVSVEKEKTEEKEKFNRREFGYSSFKRSFKLNEQVNKKKVSASYINGVLNIHIPKKEIDEADAKRKIKIS